MSPKFVAWPIRFIENLDLASKPDCWLWTGHTDEDGYGVLSVGNRPAKATHLALVLAGRWVGPNGQVNHHCDTPACCNPAHLYVGSVQQNANDRSERKRSGSGRAQAKLTWEQVTELRSLAHTASQRVLGEKFGISQTAVSAILRGKSYPNPPEEVSA